MYVVSAFFFVCEVSSGALTSLGLLSLDINESNQECIPMVLILAPPAKLVSVKNM
jgi:hypothetical protein